MNDKKEQFRQALVRTQSQVQPTKWANRLFLHVFCHSGGGLQWFAVVCLIVTGGSRGGVAGVATPP